MPARVTVWCRHPIDPDLGALYVELGQVDWYTLGEAYGAPEPLIEDALARLALAGETLDGAEVRWGAGRPLRIRRITGEELELERQQEAVPASVAETVASASEAWELELERAQAEGFGGAIAWAIGRWIAAQGDGVLHLYGEHWRDAAGRPS